MKQEAAARREEVERLEQEAEANRNAPVDDSKIVEQMFGFLPEGEQAQTADDSTYVTWYLCQEMCMNRAQLIAEEE